MWNGFWRYRYLLWNLVSRDFKLKYRRSVLGVVWSVLNTAQYTRHISSGFKTLHTTPSTLRRYFSLKSRLTRFHSR